jgi:serine/threonine protein kinase
MDGYQVHSHPFVSYPDTTTSFYQGCTKTGLPVLIKRQDFSSIIFKATQQSLSRVLTAALHQAKVQHPNCCDILEMQVQVQEHSCSVLQALEPVEGHLKQEIDAKRTQGKVYSEEQFREFLRQTASALGDAHSKVGAI